VVRIVTGLAGQVDMRSELIVRFEYGQDIPWVRRTDDGLHAVAGPNALTLDGPVRFRGRQMPHEAAFTVNKGDEVPMVLSWHPSHDERPFALDTTRALDETVAWWEDWCGRAKDVHGDWQESALRSLMTLKAP
jgi:GH15 family glucan-1,4-alpha-glucosidase